MSFASWLLAAYLALVTDAVGLCLALSPSRSLTQGPLAGAQAVLLVVMLAVWIRAGRPHPPLAPARRALRQIGGDPLTALFLAAVVVLLAYELFLGLTVPPNNFDSLWYHLARTAAWVQAHGYHWIANAPNAILNIREPVAEQENLFLFVATGSPRLFALPQFTAELALLVSIYGAARRLGYAVRPSACAAALFATFSLVMLEASTAQNDLVAASFPAVAACLLLGERRRERALAGVALGIGLGVKLTTALVWPVLLLLALKRGCRSLLAPAVGAAVGFIVIGMWGYVLNLINTGSALGGFENSGSAVATLPSYPTSVVTGIDLLYLTMDRAVLSNLELDVLAAVGILVALAMFVVTRRRNPARSLLVAVPFLAPVITVVAAILLDHLSRLGGHPLRGPDGIGAISHWANEDISAFGPIGTVTLLGLPVVTFVLYRLRRADGRQLALAVAMPTAFLLIALFLISNLFLTRFLLVPAALTAPLLARLFRGRATTAAYAVAATFIGGLTLAHDGTKPLVWHPWTWNETQALADHPGWTSITSGEAAYVRVVPPKACVGTLLASGDPGYLLYGPKLQHRVVYLPRDAAAPEAARTRHLGYVVIGSSEKAFVAEFRRSGWRMSRLGGQWVLARTLQPASQTCGGGVRV